MFLVYNKNSSNIQGIIMGCDLHAYAEKNVDGKWELVPEVEIFVDRNYFLFEFLAGVRSYIGIKPIVKPRGIPKNASKSTSESYKEWGMDAHTPSWLTLEELLEFDYEKMINNQRMGQKGSYKEFLGHEFFEDLETMKKEGIERIVFWFDN